MGDTLEYVDSGKPVIYNVKDLKEIFKCGQRQAYEIMHTNGFPRMGMGRKMVVEKTALEDWLKKMRGKDIILN